MQRYTLFLVFCGIFVEGGSLTILLNSSIRSKIYEFVSNLLKEATKISNTPTSAPTA